MSSHIGAYLQELREAQRLTTTQLAHRVGLRRATISEWQTGKRHPRLPELERTLDALGVSESQRRYALTLLQSSSAVLRLRQGAAARSDMTDKTAGHAPHSGDLLRGLRLRKGLTQMEVARAIGVRQSAVARWEQGEIWPDTERLQALCYILGAREEEMVALTTRRPTLAEGGGKEPNFEDILREVRALPALSAPPPTPALSDLMYLTMEARAWPFAARSDKGRLLLAEIYTRHGHYLSSRKRFVEAGWYADRVLDLSGQALTPEPFWRVAALVSARSAVYKGKRPRPQHGVEQLSHWLTVPAETAMNAWMRADIATYLMLAKATQSSLSMIDTACEIAERSENPSLLRWRRVDKARILVKSGSPAEALPLLSNDKNDGPGDHITTELLRVEALLVLNDRMAAHDGLLRTYSHLEAHPHLEILRSQVDALAQRF